MKRTSFLVLLMTLLQLTTYAQKEATNWYFGSKAGFSFHNGCPMRLTNGAMRTEGGSAVISHRETGELLFYTNGRTIWNRNHQPMKGGDFSPVDCQNAIGQPAMIVPVPGQAHRYYVFALYHAAYPEDEPMYDLCTLGVLVQDHSFELRYTVVDMSLESGLGAVVADQKNMLLHSRLAEKLTAIPHSNGRDYWLVTHGWGSDAFHVNLLTPNGVSDAFVQRIGSVHGPSSQNRNRALRGMMKASPNGRKIAVAVNGEHSPLDLFNFDDKTGVLSDPITLGYHTELFGLSFSPDNTKLYVANDSLRMREEGEAYTDNILQYDVSASEPKAVIASARSIIIGNPTLNRPSDRPLNGYKDMQLAPDGRIYVISSNLSQDASHNRGITINRPNERGFDCDVRYFDWGMEEVDINAGLPNFMQSYFNGLEPVLCPEGGCAPAVVGVYPNPTKGTIRFKAGDCAAAFGLRIVNAIGQQIGKVQEGTSFEDEIDISSLAPGMYTFILMFDDKRSVKKKVIKLN
ncbi:T9SS type A sorting domain-containing protein [Pontibacter sp. MBLB2868]|uniref:T9SS type A sorting domain-containing protein n=1 Tax=Pontibacter sp. MBLB2868 TaxID=3451555 RepID=UPI003F750F6E